MVAADTAAVPADAERNASGASCAEPLVSGASVSVSSFARGVAESEGLGFVSELFCAWCVDVAGLSLPVPVEGSGLVSTGLVSTGVVETGSVSTGSVSTGSVSAGSVSTGLSASGESSSGSSDELPPAADVSSSSVVLSGSVAVVVPLDVSSSVSLSPRDFGALDSVSSLLVEAPDVDGLSAESVEEESDPESPAVECADDAEESDGAAAAIAGVAIAVAPSANATAPTRPSCERFVVQAGGGVFPDDVVARGVSAFVDHSDSRSVSADVWLETMYLRAAKRTVL